MSNDAPQPRAGAYAGMEIGGRYTLSRLLATGGMAAIWQATDRVLEREVAVKVLHPHLAEDDSFVARFRTEAIAAARLRHPNIISIYDTCSDGGVEAIVMELVRGRNLRAYLDEHGPLHPAEAVHIVAEVADALAAAHRAGLVHRDVKPANILIRESGQVMVTDFGIAKLRDSTTDHTRTGVLLGSVKYLAPEQVQGGPVDARTDVYALGVVLYEALCGRVPFTGDSDTAVAMARLHQDPPLPRQLRPQIPRALEAVVMRAMARDPADRYASAVDLRAALLGAPLTDDGSAEMTGVIATQAPPPAPRPPQRPASFAQTERNWLVPTLFIVLVATAFAVAGVLIGRTEAGQELIDRAREAVTGDGSQEPAEPAPGDFEPPTIVSVRDFDPPPGDGSENGERAAAAIDGDPSTAWATETYSAGIAALKPGVGLLLELSGPAPIAEVVVESPSSGWDAAIYIAGEAAPSIDGWGTPAATGVDLGSGSHSFDTGGAEGRFVLFWVTDVPAGTKLTVSEIDVRVPSR